MDLNSPRAVELSSFASSDLLRWSHIVVPKDILVCQQRVVFLSITVTVRAKIIPWQSHAFERAARHLWNTEPYPHVAHNSDTRHQNVPFWPITPFSTGRAYSILLSSRPSLALGFYSSVDLDLGSSTLTQTITTLFLLYQFIRHNYSRLIGSIHIF